MLVRYTKTYQDEEYSSEVAVLFQELVVKLPLSLVLYTLECKGLGRMVSAMIGDVRSHPAEWLSMTLPAFFYTLNSNLIYLGLSNMAATQMQVTYQSKILFTALLAVLLLEKRLSLNQWIALGMLLLGLIAVQDLTPLPISAQTSASGASGARQEQPLLGMLAILAAALSSSFASVYFEKLLKAERKPSLWLRNIQLALYGSAVAAAGVVRARETRIAADGLCYGFNQLIWLSICWQGAGGLIIALTIKYADNILRGFAQAGAVIFVAVMCHFGVGSEITPLFGLGVVLVVAAIFLYGEQEAHTPRELLVLYCLGGTLERVATAAVAHGEADSASSE